MTDEPLQPQQDPQPESPTATQPDELTQLKAKCDEYLSGWKRALADYENVAKQQAQMRDEDRRRVRANLAEDLLGVVDNFGYVTKHIPDVSGCSEEFQKKFTSWISGIQHIDRQFMEVLKSLGVEPIESLGKPFDARLHDAAGAKKVEGTQEGIVIEELVRGWKIGDVVLRPSRVIVSE